MEAQSETPSRPETHPASPDSKASGLTNHIPHFFTQSFSSAPLFASQQQAPCRLGWGVPGGLHMSWHLSSAALAYRRRKSGPGSSAMCVVCCGSYCCFPCSPRDTFSQWGQSQGRANFCSLVLFSSVPSLPPD